MSAKLVIGVTQKLLNTSGTRLEMKSWDWQKDPPTSARSVPLKYPQHLNYLNPLDMLRVLREELAISWSAIFVAGLVATQKLWNSARSCRVENQTSVPMIRIPIASTRRA